MIPQRERIQYHKAVGKKILEAAKQGQHQTDLSGSTPTGSFKIPNSNIIKDHDEYLKPMLKQFGTTHLHELAKNKHLLSNDAKKDLTSHPEYKTLKDKRGSTPQNLHEGW